MKKFSKIFENKSTNYYKVDAEIELQFSAENEGEAGYLADSELASVQSQNDFRIVNITQITQDEFKSLETNESSLNVKIPSLLNFWDQKFGKRTASMTEKMEFYHQMRKSGFDGPSILNTLKGKISFYDRKKI